MLTTVRLNLIK